MKKYKTLLFSGFIVLLLAAIGGFWFNWATKPSSSKGGEKIFIIKKREKTDSIVRRLYQKGLIRSPAAFKILLYKEGLAGKIQAGDFKLSPLMSASELAQELTHGTLDYWVTIIEGWRAEEVASVFRLPSSVFRKEEGYLFPDTYLIPKNASGASIVKILRDNFDKKTESLLPDIQKSGLSLQETIILASIVEREAKLEGDRPLVAGILIKRWQNDWPLQADATIQYAKANHQPPTTNHQPPIWWPKVTKADLKINSPYNTYLYKGLPPTPICNPGLSSIKAVVYPQETDYWYYLSDKQGKMHYAKTLQEHTENIQKYL